MTNLSDMSYDQLVEETTKASAALYAAKRRGAPAETITKNQARLDAVRAEKNKFGKTWLNGAWYHFKR